MRWLPTMVLIALVGLVVAPGCDDAARVGLTFREGR
jgi:hypothetical protein